jgi:8-oxo-dGTP pyrophosphatase MutT (NUDIX family)
VTAGTGSRAPVTLDLVDGGPHDPGAPVVARHAARAVIHDDRGRMLMLRSRHGDLKFPGGGIDPGESASQALLRELAEECGVVGAEVLQELLRVRQLRPAQEPGAVFCMTSRYFRCTLTGEVGAAASRLEAYERDLGLAPVWVTPEAALRSNASLSSTWQAEQVADLAPWLPRETAALEWLCSGGGRPPARRLR